MLRIHCQLNKNTLFDSDPRQIPFVNSVETTHHSPAKPVVVSTTPQAEIAYSGIRYMFSNKGVYWVIESSTSQISTMITVVQLVMITLIITTSLKYPAAVG